MANAMHKPPRGSTINMSHWLSQNLCYNVPLNEGSGHTPVAFGSDFPKGTATKYHDTVLSTNSAVTSGNGIHWSRQVSTSGKAALNGCDGDWCVATDGFSGGCVLNLSCIGSFRDQPTSLTYAYLFQPTQTTTGTFRMGDTNQGLLFGFYENLTTASTISVDWRNASNTNVAPQFAYNLGDWILMAATTDGMGNVQIYQNNVLQSSVATYSMANTWAQAIGTTASECALWNTHAAFVNGDWLVGDQSFVGNMSSMWFWKDKYMTAADMNDWWQGGLWQNYTYPSSIFYSIPGSNPLAHYASTFIV